MLLFYIRHGDPIYNPDSLTPQGELQAKALSKRLGVHGIDKIFSSSSNRAIQTAKPTADLLNKEITILDWCNEKYAWYEFIMKNSDGVDMWACETPEFRELFVSEEIKAMGDKWYNHPKLKGGKFEQGLKRIGEHTDEFMLSLGYRHDRSKNGYIAERPNDERIALFAHAGFGGAFLSCLLDAFYPDYSVRNVMGHSGMTVIEFDNKEGFVIPKVLQYSNDSHIYAEGLPLKHENKIYI